MKTYLIGIILAVAMFGSGFAYRAHLDAGLVGAQRTADQLDATRALNAAQKVKEATTAQLQASADQTAADLTAKLEKSRSDYAQISKQHLPHCPVAAADVGMLVGTYPIVPGPVASPPGPGPADPPSGTVDSGALITACEVNRGTFDRNLDRLHACIDAYDAARTLINKGPPHANEAR